MDTSATAAMVGAEMGTTNRHRRVQWLAPSSAAASRMETGSVRKCWRNKKVPKRAGEPGQDQALVGVDPAKVGDQRVIGDDDDLLGHQERKHHQAKHELLERELQEHHSIGGGQAQG